MNSHSKQKILTIIFAVSAAVFLTAAVAFVNLYMQQREAYSEISRQLDAMREEKASLEAERESLQSENTELDGDIEEMLAQIASIDSSLDEKDGTIEELRALTEQIRAEIAAKNAEAAALAQQISALELENELVAERMLEARNEAQSEAAELKRKLEVLLLTIGTPAETSEPEEDTEITPDTDADPSEPDLTDAEKALFELLENGAPDRYVRMEDESIIAERPQMGYAYYDFTTGKSVTYRSDEIVYSASVIKAPYIFALIREIENFEKNKRDFDAAGNPLWDEDGNPLYEGSHPNYDAEGHLIYLPGEEKYNLAEVWTFDPETMMEEGSGEIMNKPAGFQLTWRELIEYALLYSDNIAFAQLRQRFGYTSFYQLVAELGIEGTATGFMNLSADDCVKFLTDMHDFMASGSAYGLWMKDCMVRSKHTVILAWNFPAGTCAHKYGWDIDAYHDAAVIFDEHPYALVVMSNLHDGGDVVNAYFGEIAELTKQIHAEQYADK